jgi:branched-chain amino acid transport system permease protein
MAITAAVALGIDKVIYAPLRRRGAKPVTLLIASIGATLMIQGLVRLFFGTGTYSFFDYGDAKTILRLDTSWAGGTRPITFTEPQLIMVIVTVILIVALNLFLTRSRLGKAMRAMSDNADLAQVSGINTQLVVRVTWIIAGALACAAGTMLALDVSLKPDLAFNIVLPIFAAAIVGGLGQAYGAIAGGFLLGFAETLGVFNWSTVLRPMAGVLPDWIVIPPDLSLVPTEYKLTVSFVILVITLLWRPTGIFKGQST